MRKANFIIVIVFILVLVACNQKTKKENIKNNESPQTNEIGLDTSRVIVSKKTKNNIKETENESENEKNQIVVDTTSTVVSKTAKPKVIKKENVVEIYHNFSKQKLLSDSVTIDMENTEGGMLSAYSFDTSEYELFFREQIKGSWSAWKKLTINSEVNNPERKVFKATNISNKSNSIQFKSSSSTSKEVVFRLYIFPKN